MTDSQRSVRKEPSRVLSTICSEVGARDGIFVFFGPTREEFIVNPDWIIGSLTGELDRLVEQYRSEKDSDHPFRTFLHDGDDTSVAWIGSEDARRRVRCFPLRVNSNLIGVLAVELKEQVELSPEQKKTLYGILEERNFCFARAWMFYSSECHFDHPFLVGDTDEWRKVKEHLMAAAGFDHNEYPVYIQGEPGTGKEFAAHFIHFMSGRSRHGELVSVNCPTIQEGLAGSELFGHVRGAFTGAHEERKGAFERANSGTLFLDEVADLSPDNQKRLLRAVEYGKIKRVGGDEEIDVDVRVICATKKQLEEEVNEGRFRDDLYSRLRTLKIEMPPLRRWKDTVPELIDLFSEHQEQIGGPESTFTPGAKEAMKQHDYPANCRELKNIVSEINVRFSKDEITEEDVKKFFSGYTSPVQEQQSETGRKTAADRSEEEERILNWKLEPQKARKALEGYRLVCALKATNGNVKEIAEEWEVTPKAVYKLCGQHDVEPGEFR